MDEKTRNSAKLPHLHARQNRGAAALWEAWTMAVKTENVIIMGAAGRDFHNFNVYFRDNRRYKVVCFTATQIPDIEDRRYPPLLAGDLYPEGIPIYSDETLFNLVKDNQVDLVAFSYSDVTHNEVMHKASVVTAAGADFIIIGAPYTMLTSSKKIISVCAVRTGCGKSQTSREVVRIMKDMGKKVVAVRHPMPYGDPDPAGGAAVFGGVGSEKAQLHHRGNGGVRTLYPDAGAHLRGH